jgi:hypothetical protein
MKILEPGSLPGNKVYKTRCANCKTLFEFTQKEAVLDAHHPQDPPVLKVSCPLLGCKKTAYVTP